MKKNLFVLLSALLCAAAISSARGENELDILKDKWLVYSDAPNFLYRHLATEACANAAQREADVATLKTLPEWEQYQARVKAIYARMLGPWPDKTPLNATVAKTSLHDGYKVENILFESRPKFYVTASLYLPHPLQPERRLPAILYCSGHTDDGYRGYQTTIVNLVKKGFIVFAFDPVGQGERLQYADPESGKPTLNGPTAEHACAGTQALITGGTLTSYMVWDGIRAVDYLVSRPEVDPVRLGITGRSGGGTQSTLIAAADDRIYAAAPEDYLTNFTRLLQSVGPQDAEQNLWQPIANQFDHADFLIIRAPKPAMMITTSNDIFNIQGSMDTAAEVRRCYQAYSKADNFIRIEDVAPHVSTVKNRQAMYAFFQKYLQNPGEARDETISPPAKEELQVTPGGQTALLPESESVFTLNRRRAAEQQNALQISRADLDRHLPAAAANARRLSGYREPDEIPRPVLTGRVRRGNDMIEKYSVKGEGDYVIPYLLFYPQTSNGRALLYLHPDGKAAGAAPAGEIEYFVKQGFTVLAPDLVGLGETGPGILKGDSYLDNVSHNLWYAAMLNGRSITGVRAGDTVRLARLLARQTGAAGVAAVAKRELTPVLLHAAIFAPEIQSVALIDPYSSYWSVASQKQYCHNFVHSLVPGALTAYDLPDLAAALAPKRLLMTGVTGGNGQLLTLPEFDAETAVIRARYRQLDAQKQLLLIPGPRPADLAGLYQEWCR